MKPFESFLAPQLEAYLAYRHNCLGYQTKPTRFYLRAFDQYLKQTGITWDGLQPGFFLKFRAESKRHPNTVNGLLSSLRGFFKFLVRQGLYEENPLEDIPPLPVRLFIPFVFSPEQTEQLLIATCNQIRKTEKYFLADLAVHLVVVLLARCGMRISEPIKILRTNYRAQEGTLYIERTKFNKDRLVPVPIDAWKQIDNFLEARSALLGSDQNPCLLAGRVDKGITCYRVNCVFKRAVKDIGIDHPQRIVGNMTFGSPSPHSLRHSFAINTLKRITQQGKNPQHALPVLAAYMGHQEYQYTAAYLKLIDANQQQGLIEFAKAFRARS